MSHAFSVVVRVVDRFLAGGDFMSFWSEIDGPLSDDLDQDQFTAEEASAFERLHDLAALGQESPPTPGEAADGLIGGEDLLARVRAWRSELGPA